MRTCEGMAVAKTNGELSQKQQAELRGLHTSGDDTIADLTELFSVSRPTVYRTLQRNSGV
ncbi:helix-turn-helix domain-containing protein [Streptomonospora salina]|uniref:Putative DNA-binding protein YlxM (UPF0122 family) n=1 Tax=Streptomonospora salina TaxID=104205 RepID=A0A841ECP9_9ACTN|nr:helix-turn-helix domain-containing protein [Streptomonospora salina]MBB6000915.1 putative DNA-binding protein YlxM (UPF0122 family) [Streptomonospora salina]